MQLRILYQDSSIVVVDKPAGLHVHSPEQLPDGVREPRTVLKYLRTQLGRPVYPVHRLDRATSGVLLFALDSATAGALGEAFRGHRVNKHYVCVMRGWLGSHRATEGLGRALVVDRPLQHERAHERESESDERFLPQPATTEFTPIYRWEWPVAVGRYATARYTLAAARPLSGRYHQIRRHAAGLGYPIIGDTTRGDGAHNRYFRERVGAPGLLLKALRLEFTHPTTGERMSVRARWNPHWHRLFDACGACAVG